jgi:hypothetical protein
VTLLSLKNLTSSEPLSLNFSIAKPVDWTGYSLDGRKNITIAGNTTLNGLTTGVHNITVYAKDPSGNIGASETLKFEVSPESILAEASGFLPTLTVAAVSIVALVSVAAGLLVYHKKHKGSLVNKV